MSAKVQGWVWDVCDLIPQRRLILLWLANRATDNGVCFPGQAEVRRKTGLGEKMVRRHLHWLASDVDDDGTPKVPLVTIVERRIDADRNTSNVYVLHVPWASAEQVARELEELKYVPANVLTLVQGEGVAGDPQIVDARETERWGGGHPRPPRGSPAGGMGVAGDREEPGHRNAVTPPDPPATRASRQQGAGQIPLDSAPPTAAARPATASALAPAPAPAPAPAVSPPEFEAAARALVAAFYGGLGSEPAAATTAIRRRDLAIARQLVQAGATATEAETYAREMAAMTGRMAPVDLRSFERERLSWRAQRRGKSPPLGGLRLVTGQGLSD